MSWIETEKGLYKEFEFEDFRRAFAFMMEVAFVAEELGHHPDWSNVYNKVSIYLNTHDAGGTITERDRELSRRIDQLL
ncbi:MAG: pterin-4-alpha-carbinolamine dehydratase [Flavobacteriales bacterium]|nr:pterin-4-alpha-carbinolamine dehydratase [Flavobacteriales bacterium]